MEGAPVTAATGALGPVIAKLAALLGSEYKLRWRTRRDVYFIRSKLKPVHSILWNIWEREELDAASRALKMEALDLADDVDGAIVDFIINLERSRNNKRLVQTKIKASPFQDFKKTASDVSGRCRSKWEKKKHFSTLLSCGKLATDDCRPGKPRAYPFVRKDASELVYIASVRDYFIQFLVGKDERTPVELQLKTASIYGMAGMGKSTLADLVYEAIGNKFQSRAFVSLTPGGNMREVLSRILEQVGGNTSVLLADSQASTEEHLISIISNFLNDKRYLVIIDDIWNWREWEVIMKSLPDNNLGSRIVGTTRIYNVAKHWDEDSNGPNGLLHKMLPYWSRREGWVYRFGPTRNIPTVMVSMKTDLIAEGFDIEHPIVQMCGGTPLAVLCMLSAVAEEREKQGQHAKACDVQDEVEKHVMQNGIQNTRGFEPLVESLQLGFDDIPHHMLKTCLLYCSIYPDGYHFKISDLVRRWISEGFVCKEDEAHGYLDELVNRGFILVDHPDGPRMLPMMRNFLRWKSRQDNFITYSSEITPSFDNTCKIRRLCIDGSPLGSGDTSADPLSALDWNHIRSLVVYQGIERVPLEKLKGLRMLDLCWITDLLDDHLKDICGLVHLRHLFGLNGDGIREIPQEIVRLQCLEILEATGDGFAGIPGFIGKLKQLKTLEVSGAAITELPREIGALQQLQTLGIRNTSITELPKEIGDLQQLKTLDISSTQITVLPKEIEKLQQLEHLLMTHTKVAKIQRRIGGLTELKTLDLDRSIVCQVPLQVCQVSALVELPECIHQALKKNDVLSELGREMLSFQISGGLVVGAKQMLIPQWIKGHFNNLKVLDIRICKLEEQGLKILREMRELFDLTLRFEVVPRKPIVICSEGFAMLWMLRIDSRVPRITFQEGAMPMLQLIRFQFQFYAGPPSKDSVGINHLRNLHCIMFDCNEDWYGGAESPCILPTIDVVRKEAQELPNELALHVCGHKEKIIPLAWKRSEHEMEQEIVRGWADHRKNFFAGLPNCD